MIEFNHFRFKTLHKSKRPLSYFTGLLRRGPLKNWVTKDESLYSIYFLHFLSLNNGIL
jgi:hypothetical protein